MKKESSKRMTSNILTLGVKRGGATTSNKETNALLEANHVDDGGGG